MNAQKNMVFIRHAEYQTGTNYDANHDGIKKVGDITFAGMAQSLLAGRFLAALASMGHLQPIVSIRTSHMDRNIQTGVMMNEVLKTDLKKPEPVLFDDPDKAALLENTETLEEKLRYLHSKLGFMPDDELARERDRSMCDWKRLKPRPADVRGTVVAIVNEPFLEKMFGAAGKNIKYTAGFITSAENPAANPIPFTLTSTHDLRNFNMRNLGGADKIQDGMSFEYVKGIMMSLDEVRYAIGNYRNIHRFATLENDREFDFGFDMHASYAMDQIMNSIAYEFIVPHCPDPDKVADYHFNKYFRAKEYQNGPHVTPISSTAAALEHLSHFRYEGQR
jgi:hypothetical protein